MAKNKAVYAPGELGRTRDRLGDLDPLEAKRVSQILGGEIGVERVADPLQARLAATRGLSSRTAAGKKSGREISAPRRRVELAPDRDGHEPDIGSGQKADGKSHNAADNPALPVKQRYGERVKMDRFMGQAEFEIKSPFQVLKSIFSIRPSRDLVSARFIKNRLGRYCGHIEHLVTNTRTLCLRDKLRREQLRKASGPACQIIDTIRGWNIEAINTELSRLMLQPGNNTIPEMAELLKLIYRPIFILDKLDLNTGIKAAYKLVYKIIFLENPGGDLAGEREMIKTALTSLNIIKKEIRYLLYPLLMKLLSDCWLSYDEFFARRRNRLMAFLELTEQETLPFPAANIPRPGKAINDRTGIAGKEKDGAEEDGDTAAPEQEAEKAARENEWKAVNRGLKTLETLFPHAGWDSIPSGHDLYPYFTSVFKFPKEYALISPSDGLLHIVVLLRILQELFYGLRMVDFDRVPGSDDPDNPGKDLASIINDWHYFTTALEKEYLPRMSEYCRMLESSPESRASSYYRRLLDELYWIKRFFFLPHYRFISSFPSPMQKKEVKPLSLSVRALRKYLTVTAGHIEKSIKAGGAAGNVRCEGIKNPWDPYNFPVSNPVSVRLDAILNPKQRNNVSLIFFTLAAAIVLDFLVNNETSWAYQTNEKESLFRSVNGEGTNPLWDTEKKINTNAILKEMQNRAKAKSGG
jgi:hypothetical protein